MHMPAQSAVGVADGRFLATNSKYPFNKRASTALSGTTVAKKTLAPKRVLIVEDNIDSARSFAYLISDMGHEVEYAINGYVALDMARRFKPEIVLLDIGLPGMSGFEVCEKLKREPGLEHTRVIAVTAFSRDEYRERSMAAGCELHIVKPVPVFVLEELLG
jgi:two-component system CheB/CheR fusion protein